MIILFSLRPCCDGPIHEILDNDGNIVDTMTFDGMKELCAEAAQFQARQGTSNPLPYAKDFAAHQNLEETS